MLPNANVQYSLLVIGVAYRGLGSLVIRNEMMFMAHIKWKNCYKYQYMNTVLYNYFLFDVKFTFAKVLIEIRDVVDEKINLR